MIELCKVPNCGNERKFRIGYCRKHYARWVRKGSVEDLSYSTKCVQCNGGGPIKKGLCDACYRHFRRHGDFTRRRRARGEGHINRDGYKVITQNGKRELEHRKVVQAPPGSVVHHKDENPFNNTPSNLEIMTRAEHTALHHKLRS